MLCLLLAGALAACNGGGGEDRDGGPPPGDGAPPPGELGAGLTLDIQDAAIDPAGVATATVRITDGQGVPISAGVGEEGGVQPSLTLAWLDQTEGGAPRQYTAYTTREQTSPITGDTAVQASSDSGGTWTAIDANAGHYRYTFGTSAAGFDGSKTHTVAIWGRRTFEGADFSGADTFHFRPDGGDVEVIREVVTDDTCNKCHGTVRAHGGQRVGTQQCILCHSPQTVDPDTGNTVDFKVMVHKIHAGHQLPSVQAGGSYEIIGFQQSIHDYSEVRFPQDIRNCQSCHAGMQGNWAYEQPGLQACGSCHDDVWFGEPPAPEGLQAHAGGPQADSSNCSVCHPAMGGLEGVYENHLTPLTDPDRPRIGLGLVSIADTGPGQQPVITFEVSLNDQPLDILAEPLSTLRATFAGPNTDFARYWQATIQGNGATGTLAATDTPGRFTYTVAPEAAIPADATGSFTVGLEGYLTRGETRHAALNPTLAFAVDGELMPRRQIVATDLCNSCHLDLQAHGGQRKDAQYCTLCHNPNNANDERTARVEGADVFVETVDLRSMIHRIHAGEFLSQKHIYGGFPGPSTDNPQGTPLDFSRVRFPRRLSDCTACHRQDSWNIPTQAGLLPSLSERRTCTEDPGDDGDQLCDLDQWVVELAVFTPPIQSACLGCHDSPAAIAHAQVMTSDSGAESCQVCHGPGEAEDVSVVHLLE